MPETGLEPALPEGNQPLKLARLPIPPLRHKYKEDRGSKIEDREISRLFVDPQSSILNLRSSIFDPQSSILNLRFRSYGDKVRPTSPIPSPCFPLCLVRMQPSIPKNRPPGSLIVHSQLLHLVAAMRILLCIPL